MTLSESGNTRPDTAVHVNRMPLMRPIPWPGRELSAYRGWQHTLCDADIDEIDLALRSARGLAWSELSPATFPLGGLGKSLQSISVELADGSGVAKLSGLPVSRFSDADLRTVYLGLSTYLGTPTAQNGGRGLLRDIQDRSVDGGRRVDSAEALNWHNDRTDIVGLLCVREAAAGGMSRLASATAIHNAMLERCPELLEVLFLDFSRHAPGDEVGDTTGCHALPVFRMDEGRLSVHYSRTYIEQAASLPGSTPLSRAQRAALDALVSIADELAFEMRLEAGEMQFLSNHAILHSRSAFRDDPGRGGQRLLFRVWLAAKARGAWDA